MDLNADHEYHLLVYRSMQLQKFSIDRTPIEASNILIMSLIWIFLSAFLFSNQIENSFP